MDNKGDEVATLGLLVLELFKSIFDLVLIISCSVSAFTAGGSELVSPHHTCHGRDAQHCLGQLIFKSPFTQQQSCSRTWLPLKTAFRLVSVNLCHNSGMMHAHSLP